MNNSDKRIAAESYLDAMVESLKSDIVRIGDLTPDDFAAMVETLTKDGTPEWIDCLLWILAVAQFRLANEAVAS